MTLTPVADEAKCTSAGTHGDTEEAHGDDSDEGHRQAHRTERRSSACVRPQSQRAPPLPLLRRHRQSDRPPGRTSHWRALAHTGHGRARSAPHGQAVSFAKCAHFEIAFNSNPHGVHSGETPAATPPNHLRRTCTRRPRRRCPPWTRCRRVPIAPQQPTTDLTRFDMEVAEGTVGRMEALRAPPSKPPSTFTHRGVKFWVKSSWPTTTQASVASRWMARASVVLPALAVPFSTTTSTRDHPRHPSRMLDRIPFGRAWCGPVGS